MKSTVVYRSYRAKEKGDHFHDYDEPADADRMFGAFGSAE